MALSSGHDALCALAKALGLDARKVRRFVLDCRIDEVTKLYVEEFPDSGAVTRLAAVLPGVEVVRAGEPPKVGPEPLLKITHATILPDGPTPPVPPGGGAYERVLLESDWVGEEGQVKVPPGLLDELWCDVPVIVTADQAVS